jgi:hypothetical protein
MLAIDVADVGRFRTGESARRLHLGLHWIAERRFWSELGLVVEGLDSARMESSRSQMREVELEIGGSLPNGDNACSAMSLFGNCSGCIQHRAHRRISSTQ